VNASPIISAARPLIRMPIPMLTSANPCDCTISAPPVAEKALAMPTPPMVAAQTLMPCASAMSGLEPTARMAVPFSVLK